ncbi:hypothetical protein K523DRAFT_281147, partial [Schizophyllum commune Tattone D]
MQHFATTSLREREEPDLQTLRETLLAPGPLSSQDILEIQPHILLAEAGINKYSVEIDGLSRLLHLLATEKDELEGKRDELARIHAGAIWRCAPISRLVPDVLTEIFCFVRDTNEYSLRDYDSAILPLAHTCRLWRHVAFSQPLLWASIKVCFIRWWQDKDDPAFHNRVARAVKFHLDRSGDALLSICIECDPCSACDALLAVRHRWRECHIRKFNNERDVRLQPAHYPSLEHLELELYQGTHASFKDSPLLRSYSGPIVDVHLPWRQLTRLTIVHDISSGNLLAPVLNECGGLEYLKFDLSDIAAQRGSTTAMSTTFHLPMLRQLILTCLEWKTTISRVLLCVEAPALESLEICVKMESDILVGVADALAEFLSHCGALRALSLKNVPIGRRDLHRVLEYVTNVERLVWWDLGKCTSTALLKMLAAPPPPQPVNNDLGDIFEDHVLPFPHLGDDEDSGDDGDGDSSSDDSIDGFDGSLLPRLSCLEISGGLSPREQLMLIEHAVVSRTLRRDDPTDVAPLRHVVLELLGAGKVEQHVQSAVTNGLPSINRAKHAHAALDPNHHHRKRLPSRALFLSFSAAFPPFTGADNMSRYNDPKTMFPEATLCMQTLSHTDRLSIDCYGIYDRLKPLQSRPALLEVTQDTLRYVGNYVVCLADAMKACYRVFLAIGHAIQSDVTSPESDLAAIYERCDIYARFLDELTSMANSTIRAVDNLQRRVEKELSYPPGIHYLMMHALGPSFWQEREVALTEVPPILDVVREDVKGIAALVTELKLHAKAMRERFSIVQLGQIKALPAQVRHDVKVLVQLSLNNLPVWANTVGVHGSCIL